MINLLEDLQQQFGLTYLFIAHDLSVVEHISDRVAVMYLGRIVEIAPARDALRRAAAPVHRGPAVGGADSRPQGQAARASRSRATCRARSTRRRGCHFHTRCPIAQQPLCSRDKPQLKHTGDGHWVACHLRS